MKPEVRQHYLDSLGLVPPAVTALFDMNERFGEHFTDVRRLIFEDRSDGLPLAVKELVFVIIDAILGNVPAGIHHLRAARKAGLTETQLADMFLVLYFETGASNWGISGHRIWSEWAKCLDDDARGGSPA